MSTPFVAAIIDVVGIVIYMNLAMLAAQYLFADTAEERKPDSDINARVADVELQDLALHLDGAHQNPDDCGDHQYKLCEIQPGGPSP